MQGCTPIELEHHAHGRDGNFPSPVGICIAYDESGVPVGMHPVFANDSLKYPEAVVYISAYKRCMGRSCEEMKNMKDGEHFLDSTYQKDLGNLDGSGVTVDFVDVAVVQDEAEDDNVKQLAYRITFKPRLLPGGSITMEFTPQDFVQALLQVSCCRHI